MKAKSIVTFLGIAVVLVTLFLGFAHGGDVAAQEGKQKTVRAVPTVTKKMNANYVDGLHAAASPSANKLLALDGSAKYPDSTIPDSIQRRVSGACAAGSSIRVINANGTVTCEADDSGGGGGWGLTGNAGTNPANNFVGTSDNQSLVLRTNNAERVRIATNGNVGIGTNNPGFKLDVSDRIRLRQGSGPSAGIWFHQTTPNNDRAFVGMSDDSHVGLYGNTGAGWSLVADTTSGNIGIGTTAPAHRLGILGGPFWTSNFWLGAVELSNASAIGWQTNTGNQSFGLGQTNGGLFFFRSASNPGTTSSPADYDMTITDKGKVGIGTIYPRANLMVKGKDISSAAIRVFQVETSDGKFGFGVDNFGQVNVGTLLGPTTTHACFQGGNFFATCGSAAEYVPSIDSGNGFPEAADLVSIAPDLKNPYGDTHGPFTVVKSAVACDPNLLGFIVNPESGADGKKLNEHYLPLAIYGYFPAKVTMENGAIQRGDPLTSSSKPGYAMKATSACKIIGYALEDATKEGQIQVFADSGESSAAEVATLREQVDALTRENGALKQQLRSFEERLNALETNAPVTKSEDTTAKNTVAITP